MKPAQLLAHFERISDAPDAVPRLRRFILDLAVRGKLVEQDPNDEPVSELLKRIRAEKSRLGKDGRIKTIKTYPPVTPSEASCRLPRTWQYVRLGAITNVVMGQSPPGSTYNRDGQGIPLINGPVEFSAGPFGKTVVNQFTTEPTNYCERGDLLICVRGSTTGRTNIAAFWACIGRGVAAIRPVFEDRFVRLAVTGLRESIIAMGRGIAFPSVSRDQIESLVIPLPPLTEQNRIVAKVDELMALCDRLEAAQAERESRRDRLVAASLHRLNEPADPLDLRAHAQFHLRHLPRLATRPEHVQQLRHAILNLATQGKLTSHWRLQQRGLKEASQIVKTLEQAHETAGGHRRGNAAAPTDAAHDLDQCELPETWRTTELRIAVDPARPITYGILMPGPDTPGGVPYVRVADFPNDQLNLATIRRTTPEIEGAYARARLQQGDILLSIRGTVGRVCIVPEELQDANITQDTARLSIQPALDRDFVVWFLRSPAAQERMWNCQKGVAVRGINIGDVRALQLPVPPLSEQRQITAKVNELLAVCDRLEAQLGAARSESRRLLEAVLHEALAPPA